MNLEIANRLVELRKRHGYSQEALADKLGVSRQAVSKWERVEAAPDTDNLIALAQLYGVSLDELLGFEKSKATVTEEQTDEAAGEASAATDDGEGGADDCGKQYDEAYYDKKYGGGVHIEDGKDSIHIGPGGIHIRDDEDDVHINWRGIHINSKEDAPDRVHIGKDGHAHFEWEDGWYKGDNLDLEGISSILVVIAYLLMGFIGDLWHPGWIVFFAIPVLPALIKPKKWEGCFPVFVTGAYLLMGCVWNLWHPGWVVFLLVPVFYTIWNGVKHRKRIR